MKISRAVEVVFAFSLLCSVIRIPAFAQVTIVRQPPASGLQKGKASWSTPYPDSAMVHETGIADFKGRISIGGRGGQDKNGETVYDLATDSFFSMIQPLRGDALLSIDAKLLRFQSSAKENQDYNGTISLELNQFSFETSGGYKQSLSEISGVDSDDTDWWISAAVSSGLLETLPMSLDYQSTWVANTENENQTYSGRIDQFKFKTAGTVSRVGVELDADIEYEDNREEENETLGTAGNLKVIIPLGQKLWLQFIEVPVLNRSENTDSRLRTISLESGIGLNWLLNEELQANIRGGRVDAWIEDLELETNTYQDSWKLGLGVDYRPPEGFFGSPSYYLTKAVGGNWTHDLLLPAGWLGRGTFKEISAKGSSTIIQTDTGGRVKDSLDWMLKTALLPAESMNLTGDYKGGYLWQDEGESWNHKMSVEFSHNPAPFLKYRGVYTLSNNQEDESEDLWKHEGIVAMTINPMINFKVYTIDMSETLDMSYGESGDDILSSALLKVAVPFNSEFTTSLGCQWEWINRISVDGNPGNYLHYSAGLSVAGNSAPFSLNSEYSFSHGYRGPRHDVNSLINVPLGRGYAIETVFSLNNYYENKQSILYWLLGLNLVYEF